MQLIVILETLVCLEINGCTLHILEGPTRQVQAARVAGSGGPEQAVLGGSVKAWQKA